MSDNFKQSVEKIVRLVPRGKVVTYGQVAAMVGQPRSARMVGWTAHWGDPEIPWQRVLNRFGGLATGYPGGRVGHAEDLRREGIAVKDDSTVELATYQWFPDESLLATLNLPPEAEGWLEQRLPFSTR